MASTVHILKSIYLMAIFDGGGDLSEDASSIAFCEPVVVDVVVEFSTVCMLHHQNDLVLVLKHWKYTRKEYWFVFTVFFVVVKMVGTSFKIHDNGFCVLQDMSEIYSVVSGQYLYTKPLWFQYKTLNTQTSLSATKTFGSKAWVAGYLTFEMIPLWLT